MLSNIILLIMALPLVRVWVSILRIPTRVLYPVVLGIMTIGAFTINNNVFEVGVMWVFGLVGLAFHKFSIPLAPMALTLVLGPMLESNLRRALSLNTDLLTTLTDNPIALAALLLIVAIFLAKATFAIRRRIRPVPEATLAAPGRR